MMMINVRTIALAGLAIAAGWPASVAIAQFSCPDPSWNALDPSLAVFPGVDGLSGRTLMWDPDGAPGPVTPKLVVTGIFTTAGTVVGNNVALFDPTAATWSSLKSGTNGQTNVALAMPNGDLVVGGYFTAASGVPANRIVRWNVATQEWSAFGSGMDHGVWGLATLPDGDIVAGGQFKIPANQIARWDEATGSWSPMASGMDGMVWTMTTMINGDLIAGGYFDTAGGVPAKRIARWDEVSGTWSSLGSGMNLPVNHLLVLPSGDLIAAGQFTTAGGIAANRVARWDGSSWTPLGTGVPGEDRSVSGIIRMPDGNLIAGVSVSPPWSSGDHYFTRWDAATNVWSTLESKLTGLNGSGTSAGALTMVPGGDLIVTGRFEAADGQPAYDIARWTVDAGTWSSLGLGIEEAVQEVESLPNGDVVLAGNFSSIMGVQANRIAHWDLQRKTWLPMGSGMNDWVLSLQALPSGDVVAGGRFSSAGGIRANRIAQWNTASQQWQSIGSGLATDQVTDLAVLASGDMLAACSGFSANAFVARWNGSTWTSTATLIAHFNAVAAFSNGDLIAGGSVPLSGIKPGAFIGRWNGSTWSTIGGGIGSHPSNRVNAVVVLESGDLIAAGSFMTAGGLPAKAIARWDGLAWSALGAGMEGEVYTLKALTDGKHLVAGGQFSTVGPNPVSYVAQWNGSAWIGLDSGVNDLVLSLTLDPLGDLLAAGTFTNAGGAIAPYLARYGCPPEACYPDCDASGSLNIDDFICFQTLFAIGDPQADCDASGSLDIDDFVCFQTFFAIGC